MRTRSDVTAHGATMPALGLGTSGLDDATAEAMLEVALDAGCRHVDTADMYGNEVGVGRGVRRSSTPRDEVFVTTKVLPRNAARDDVAPALEASLDRLGLDHVDLALLHWPNADVPVEETVEALVASQQRGMTRLVGISNHPTELMRRAAAAGPVFTNQVEFHPYLAQDDVRAAAAELGMTITAYSPLAQGAVFDDPVLTGIANDHGVSAGQVALRWLLDHDGVAAVPRSGNPDHVRMLFDLDMALTPDEADRIGRLASGRRLVDPRFAPDWD